MPLYEYKCSACHSVFEVLQKAGDKPPQVCQKCGGKLCKLVSSPAIQFKGNGWYVTDYARKSTSSPESKPKEKPSSDGGKKETPPSSTPTD